MKGPKPSLLEIVLGQTVEIELPGQSGLRKVSKKWFDRMVAEGRIRRTSSLEATPVAEEARVLVNSARLGPMSLFVPVLDDFPLLADATPEDWDFFLGISVVAAGLTMYKVSKPSQNRAQFFEEEVSHLLQEWASDAQRALSDCKRFLANSATLLGDSTIEPTELLQKCLGVWIFKNVMRRLPQDDGDYRLATVLGNLSMKIAGEARNPS